MNPSEERNACALNAAASRKECWVRAGWLIDGRGGPALEDQLIGLRDGIIHTIRPAREGRPADLLDLSDATVLPALIDAHVHLALGADGGRAAREEQTALVARHLHQYWQVGVLSVRDAGDDAGAALAYKRRSPAGGPPVRLAAAGWGWHAAGRYGRLFAQACPPGQPLAEVVITQAGADHVKLVQSGINSLEHFGRSTRIQFTPPDLQSAVRAARAAGRPVMVHANGVAPVATSLAAGCDSIEHGYFMGSANLACMAAEQTVWVPTLTPMALLADHPALSAAQRDVARRTLAHQLEQVGLAHRLGVPLAAGTDAGSPGVVHGASLWHELALLVAAGLSLEAAVGCATLNASRLLRREHQGALQAGWRGDLIAVAGKPSQVLAGRAVVAIHCAGRWWRPG